MDIITTARRFDLTPEVREHARKRLLKLERYLDRTAEAHVVLEREKYRQIAEISLHARGVEISSREESDDILVSIDRVVDRIERQVKRLNSRRKTRSKVRRGEAPAPAAAAGEGEEEEAAIEDTFAPVVIRQEGFHREPLSVEEAIEKLQDSENEFLLFTNKRDGRVALVHLRPDGNFGLIETL
ncbi:MAG: ribosome-associated translation inhibitor RaiA [Candidatus Eisenbacteria bacterium]